MYLRYWRKSPKHLKVGVNWHFQASCASQPAQCLLMFPHSVMKKATTPQKQSDFLDHVVLTSNQSPKRKLRVGVACAAQFCKFFYLPVRGAPGEYYYNIILCFEEYFPSSSVVSRAFSALCVYSQSGIILIPRLPLCKFRYFRGLHG